MILFASIDAGQDRKLRQGDGGGGDRLIHKDKEREREKKKVECKKIERKQGRIHGQ